MAKTASKPVKLGLIAGGGRLPFEILKIAKEQGRECLVAGLDGFADSDLITDDDFLTGIGKAGTVISRFKQAGVEDIIFAGHVKRPSLSQMSPDSTTAKFLAKVSFKSLGDNSLLEAVKAELKTYGFNVIGLDDLTQGLFVGKGCLGQVPFPSDSVIDLDVAISAAKKLGADDKGQAVVVKGGQVVSTEGSDGTDAMLRKLVGSKPDAKGGMLLKAVKPQQDRSLDLPTIGAKTIELAVSVGLDVVAVEANGGIVLQKDEVIEQANKSGLCLYGFEAPIKPKLKIGLIAGEPSGDQLGAWLMMALKAEAEELAYDLSFVGVGGSLMENQGLKSQVPMSELAVNGVTDVLRKLRPLKKHIKNTIKFFKQESPDVLVSIDAPGFSFRVVKQLTDKNMSLVHYVAPTVWAWKPKRAAKIAKFLDHLLVLLPFEPKYFTAEGLGTTFVGHPVSRQAQHGLAERFKLEHEIPEDKKVLLILPGSRAGEINNLLPVFEEGLAKTDPKVLAEYQIVLPTVSNVEHLVQKFGKKYGWNVKVINEPAKKWDVLKAGTVALAASGTVSLELATAGVATLVGYKASPITTFIAKRLVKVKYASLVNILADAEVQPELLADKCTAEKIAEHLSTLLTSEAERSNQTNLAAIQVKKL
ncbi:MAG: lipid-A-disaccharide synthase, partial [Alphaproteobacteria bacterium]